MKRMISISAKLGMLIVLTGLLVSSASAQRKITGKVTSGETGSALPGATVKVKGSATGVSTGADGSFSIDVPSNNAVIEFSFVGFESREIGRAHV